MSARTPASVLAAAILLSVAAGLAGGESRAFRSDEIGMALESIPSYRVHEFPWVLIVETRPDGTEVRRLLADGVEQRRWEIKGSPDGRREEREYDSAGLAARRLFGKGGELVQEELFKAGKPAGRTVFQYADGALSRATTYAADGTVASTSEYLLTPSGRLREVRTTVPQGERKSAGQVMGSPRSEGAAGEAAPASRAEDRTRSGEEASVARYDSSGRLVLRERREAGAVVERELLRYEGEERTPSSSMLEWPAQSKARETFYAGGVERSQRTAVLGTVVESITWQRDAEARPLAKRRTTARGAEEWRYSYGDGGTLVREEYLERGLMVSVTTYGEADERTVELYADGLPFMRVYWNGDHRTKEEVILDGTAVREKVFD